MVRIVHAGSSALQKGKNARGRDASMKWKPKLVSTPRPKEASDEQVGSLTASDLVSPTEPAPWVTDRRLSLAVLLALTAGALYVAFIIYRPFLTAIFLAFVLSIAFAPLHERITRRMRNRNVAALATTTVVMLCILVPLILVSIKVLAEAASFYGFIAEKYRSSGAWYHFGSLPDVLQRASERTGMPLDQLKSAVAARGQQLGSWLVGAASSAARGVVQQMLTAILVFLVLFFLLRDQEQFRLGIYSILPLPPPHVLELTGVVHESIIANVYGMFAVGLVQGVLTALGFWMTGLRAPLLWGVMAMVFSFIPLVGPSLVWMPGAFVLATQGDWSKAIILFLWGSIVISAADYIIRPRVAGGGSNANRALVLLSFLGGVKAFGVIGIFVGPVILALIIALLRILRQEQTRAQEPASKAA